MSPGAQLVIIAAVMLSDQGLVSDTRRSTFGYVRILLSGNERRLFMMWVCLVF